MERVGRAIRQPPDREVAESEAGAERMNVEFGMRDRSQKSEGDWFLRLGNKFLKPRIVTQRVPPRVQTQLAIGNWAGNANHCFQLLQRKIFFTCPSISDGQISQYLRAGHRVFSYRKELDGAPAVCQSIVPISQAGLAHS